MYYFDKSTYHFQHLPILFIPHIECQATIISTSCFHGKPLWSHMSNNIEINPLTFPSGGPLVSLLATGPGSTIAWFFDLRLVEWEEEFLNFIDGEEVKE